MARIYKRGKSWYLDFTYKGKRIRRAVGKDRKTAELALKDTEVRIAREEHLGIHENKRVLFEEFAEEYFEYSRVNKAKSSFERDVLSISHLKEAFGGVLLSEISTEQIEKYKIMRRNEVSPASVNRELACLSHMFTLARKWEIISHDPTKSVKKFKEPPGRIRFLTYDEINQLLDNCAPHLKPIIITALNTGMRKSEILNLEWRSVDLIQKIITMRKSKNNEMRTIPINNTLYKTLLDIHTTDCKFVFHKDNGSPYRGIKNGFNAALRRARISDCTFHDLHHTFASHLAIEGFSLQLIRRLLGHKCFRVTLRYAHLSQESLRSAVMKLNSKIGTILAQAKKKEKFTLINPYIITIGGLV